MPSQLPFLTLHLKIESNYQNCMVSKMCPAPTGNASTLHRGTVLCFPFPGPAAFLAGPGVSSSPGGVQNSGHLAAGMRSWPLERIRESHVECDLGLVSISTETFQRAGPPNTNKSLPEYFWKHCDGAALSGWECSFSGLWN